jgi:S1-C subfamily serine protease
MNDRERGGSSALPLLLAGAACAVAGYTLWDRANWQPSAQAPPRTIEPRGSLAEFEKTSVAVFETVSPAVVHITSPEVATGRDWYGNIYGIPAGTGTGFVWDENGYIVTNWHVVRERQAVLVRFANGRQLEARVINMQADQDIAVVKLRSIPPGLRSIPKVGTSSDLKVGQAVFAIGNPFGYDQSLTTGIISALNRKIMTGPSSAIEGCIQVDAAINPGNSGGPLLDSAGRLIGMNTAIYSPSGASAGIGFAIPVDTINQFVPTIIDPSKRTPLLGVILQPTDDGSGVEIAHVEPGSGAASAGLIGRRQAEIGLGDVILSVDGKAVRTGEDVRARIRQHKVGDEATLEVMRGLPDREERVQVKVRLQ